MFFAIFLQIQKLTHTQEELIRDLLSGCESGLFAEMKQEYLVESKNQPQFQTNAGNGNIWVQFESKPFF